MIQLLTRVQTHVCFASATTPYPVFGQSEVYDFGDFGKTPMPWAATMRNLVMASGDATRTGDITQTLQKNGVDTLLTKTLLQAASGPVSDEINDISLVQFDDVRWLFTNSAGPVLNPGNTLGSCVEIDSIGNIFGVDASRFGSAVVGIGGIGGALGNGFWQTWDNSAPFGPATFSTSYSICSVPGSLTRLVLRSYADAPPIGAGWIAFYRLNGVVQDGSLGTVDTRCELIGDGVTRTAAASFDLPIVEADRVEVLYYRTGTDLGFTLSYHVGIGIGFIPTVAGKFMLTGGSNQSLSIPGFVWPLSAQFQTDETLAQAPIGPGGFVATGLFIRAPSPGTPADTVTRFLRNTSVNTAIAVPLTGVAETGLITGQNVPFVQGNYISISQEITAGAPNASKLYWGLALQPIPLDGTIIVVKNAGGDTTTPFDFVASGGLSPGTFQLVGGAQQVFSAVPIGSGYGIAETPPAEWQLDSIQVSNGDSPTNITIIGGDIVTVTFTNSLRRGAAACPQPSPAPVTGQNACPTPNADVV